MTHYHDRLAVILFHRPVGGDVRDAFTSVDIYESCKVKDINFSASKIKEAFIYVRIQSCRLFRGLGRSCCFKLVDWKSDGSCLPADAQ